MEIRTILFCGVLAVSGSAEAELFGLPNAGVASLPTDTTITFDAGLTTGEFESADYSHLGGRVHFQLNESLSFFGDIGNTELGRGDQTTYGAGVVLDIGDNIGLGDSILVKGSYHKFEMSALGIVCGSLTDCSTVISTSSRKDVSAFTGELIVTGQRLGSLSGLDTPPAWYLNVGLHMFSEDDIDSTIGLGGGLIFTAEQLKLYVAADLIDDLTISLGAQFGFR